MALSKTDKNINSAVMTGLLDIITPQEITFSNDYFIFGEQLARILYVVQYPPRVGAAWMVRIANMPGVVCSMHVIPTEPDKLIESINKSIGELGARLRQGGNALMISRTEASYKDANTLLKKIDQEQQMVFNFVVLLMVIAKDKEMLERRTRKVEAALAGSGMRGRVALFRQLDGFNAAGPWGIIPPEIELVAARNMPSETIAAAFPFASSGINDGKGFILGNDKGGNIILLDIWRRGGDRTNSNWLVLGKPGVGKSTSVKKILTCEYAHGSRIIIIDPEREYKELCERIGGCWIDCGGGTKGRINPFQVKYVPLDDDEDEGERLYSPELVAMGPLALHFHTLRTFFRMYLKDLTDFEQAIFEETWEELYQKFGIQWDTDPATIKNEEWPVMRDEYELLREKAENAPRNKEVYDKLAYLVRSAAIGADSPLWSGHTTIEADSDFIVLDTHTLQEADDKIKRTQYFNVLTWAWNELSKDRTERVLLGVDEAYLMADPDAPQALMFLRNTSKRIRKYEGGLLVITHSVVDFDDPAVRRHGQALLNNPCYKLLMGAGEKDIEALSKIMNLTEQEQQILEVGNRKEGLLVAGSKRVHAVVELADHEPELFGSGGGN